MSETPPLIATRFHIPSLRSGLVARPRLHDLLDRGASLAGHRPGGRDWTTTPRRRLSLTIQL